MGKKLWDYGAVLRFIDTLFDPSKAAYRSVPGGPATLYGTCYAELTKYYLGIHTSPHPNTVRFMATCQDGRSGHFVGPELAEWSPLDNAVHDRDHLLMHLTSAALPVFQQFSIAVPHRLFFAREFCNLDCLRSWLTQRDLRTAWLEGNNILFVGQFLVYLRDVERVPEAQAALNMWFDWLDSHVDPTTGLWGSNGLCSLHQAVFGGYHQLLVYYYEDHALRFRRQLVDSVLDLQHADGGFSPTGGGGACEDVDAVDILVNMYKQIDYRRPAIRCALRRCTSQILHLQNSDGGFPYKRNAAQSHMGVPGTEANPNVSTMFATWFRVHALCLVAEVLTDSSMFPDGTQRFNSSLSMGWHRQWDRGAHQLGVWARIHELPYHMGGMAHRLFARSTRALKRIGRFVSRYVPDLSDPTVLHE